VAISSLCPQQLSDIPSTRGLVPQFFSALEAGGLKKRKNEAVRKR